MNPTPPKTASTMAEALRQAMEALGGVQRKPAIEEWIWARYPNRWAVNTLVGHLNGCCVNNPSGIKNHPGMLRFLYYRGGGEYELYNESRHGIFDESGRPEGQQGESSTVIDEISNKIVTELAEQTKTAEFAYEAHLRDYLAKNLSLIEAGLSLWTGNESGSVEYPLRRQTGRHSRERYNRNTCNRRTKGKPWARKNHRSVALLPRETQTTPWCKQSAHHYGGKRNY